MGVDQLRAALRNAHNAGDTESAQRLAALIQQAENAQMQSQAEGQLEQLFGQTQVSQPQPDPTLGDYGRAAATMVEGAVTGIPRQIIGGAEGVLTALTSDNPGAYGRAAEGREAYNRRFENWATPQTQGSQEVLQTLEPLSYITDPLAGALPAISPTLTPGLYARALRGQPLPEPQAPPLRQRDPRTLDPGAPLRGLNMGAAQTSTDAQRAAATQQIPIPLTGQAQPTLGQLTRDPVVVRRELELAKNDDLGGPLRERRLNQNEVLNRNLDYQVEQFNAQNVDDRAIGRSTMSALEQRQQQRQAQVNAAYAEAREAGELAQPATLGKLDDLILETERMESLAPNARPILNEARRMGVIDDNGIPQSVALDDLETFRQFVVRASDIGDKRESAFRRQWLNVIDSAIDKAGVGEKYRNARRLHRTMVEEFEETPIVSNLLTNKRGTQERRVAFEDVFKKTLLDGSVDEINKLRGSLLRTDEGKQAWFDLKARLAKELTDRSRTSQTDSNDQPLISYYNLQKNINNWDKSGKLESIFGKRGAEELRNLSETVRIVQSAPPGTSNPSGTAAEVFNSLMRVVKGTPLLGAPVRKVADMVETGQLKGQVRDSLTLKSRPDLQSYVTEFQDILEGR